MSKFQKLEQNIVYSESQNEATSQQMSPIDPRTIPSSNYPNCSIKKVTKRCNRQRIERHFIGVASDSLVSNEYEVTLRLTKKGAAQVEIFIEPQYRSGNSQIFVGRLSSLGGTLIELNGHDTLSFTKNLDAAFWFSYAKCWIHIIWPAELRGYLNSLESIRVSK